MVQVIFNILIFPVLITLLNLCLTVWIELNNNGQQKRESDPKTIQIQKTVQFRSGAIFPYCTTDADWRKITFIGEET